MQEAKTAARRQLLAARNAMPGEQRGYADLATWKALRDFLIEVVDEGAVVAAYRPFGSEPGAALEPELPERLAVVYKVLEPVLLPDKDLAWREVGGPGGQEEPDANSRGGDGPNPGGEVLGPEGIEQAAAVIVPGLAVSDDGIRLGRGGGSYDRALARVGPDVPVVALLRDGELGYMVPAEPHDQPVTGAITPARGFVSLR
ncbi:5-formyltetrahydrofolate cyclo-ligase [Glycomyces luteolus]|uniref:5-formyltetrahydrofolate cyclo-ligase n=1 Tax=Glycomyces luteolus TaxID=2670330 RepID=A0A9X3P8B8_9ACTN|nr:5-formyltetrahydrofolate cyclo-ligase [Glycomyces luteolus]MDA1360573.1 5-formyltetrahydrofolate cyclo-ligase [Glycomyces luteolus]